MKKEKFSKAEQSASSYEFTGGNTGADFNTEEEVA